MKRRCPGCGMWNRDEDGCFVCDTPAQPVRKPVRKPGWRDRGDARRASHQAIGEEPPGPYRGVRDEKRPVRDTGEGRR